MLKLPFIGMLALDTEITLQSRLIFVHHFDKYFITLQLPCYLF